MIRSALATSIVAAILFLPKYGHAELIRYEDKTGRVFYVDHPSKVPPEFLDSVRSERDMPRISRGGVALYSNVQRSPVAYSPEEEIGKKDQVEIYVTEYCPYCNELEAYLRARKISFKKRDIDKDRQALKEFRALGGTGVPLTRIGKRTIGGFNSAAFDREQF